ncbi:MAG: S8 family serine peptidase [bacterium]
MKQKNKKTIFNYLISNIRLTNNLRIKLFFIFLIFLFLIITPAYALIPNDAGYSFQWYLEKISAPQAWDITTGNGDTVIAFIDSGIDITHPDLKKNIWINMDEIGGDNIDNDRNGYIDDIHGWNFVESNNDVAPVFEKKCIDANGAILEDCKLGINHGTIIAGIAGAIGNNKKGIAGIIWDQKIMALKALDGKGYGQVNAVVKAVNYAVENGADIINLSLVGESYSEDLKNALENAYEKGVMIIAAAGNKEGGGTDMDKYPRYPVCYKGKNGENIILGVAGTDKNDNLADFSNFGKNCIDIIAPATEFYSTSVYNPKYEGFESYYSGLWSGTSLATPIISGLAALIKSARPALSNDKIYDLIITNSDNLNSPYVNAGRVNFLKTLQFDFTGDKHGETYIIASPQTGKESAIRQFRNDGIYLRSFLAYEETYLGGISIASGDVYGNGKKNILVAKSYGDTPEIRIFDYSGNLKLKFLAYSENFKGGVNICAGDIDGDGIDEIITGAGFSGGPHIRIFDSNGNIKSQFFAYAENFKGGVKVASGDIDGDGIDEIISGAGKGGRSHIRIFNMTGKIKAQFFAYNQDFYGGINVSCGDIDNNGVDDIIVAPLSEGNSHIRIFDAAGIVKGEFFSFEENFYGGVNINVSDINNDGKAEIIAGKGAGGNSEIKIFDAKGIEKLGFFPFDKFKGGVNIGTIDIN